MSPVSTVKLTHFWQCTLFNILNGIKEVVSLYHGTCVILLSLQLVFSDCILCEINTILILELLQLPCGNICLLRIECLLCVCVCVCVCVYRAVSETKSRVNVRAGSGLVSWTTANTWSAALHKHFSSVSACVTLRKAHLAKCQTVYSMWYTWAYVWRRPAWMKAFYKRPRMLPCGAPKHCTKQAGFITACQQKPRDVWPPERRKHRINAQMRRRVERFSIWLAVSW